MEFIQKCCSCCEVVVAHLGMRAEKLRVSPLRSKIGLVATSQQFAKGMRRERALDKTE